MKAPLDHLRKVKKGTYKRVPIALDSEVLTERDRLRSEVAKLDMQFKLTGKEPSRAAKEEIDDLKGQLEIAEDKLEENVAWFHVQSMGPRAWDKLVSQHPPTADQRQQAKKDGIQALLYNPETFPDAAILNCVRYVYVDPDTHEETLEPLTQEFLDEMRDGDQWTAGEILELAEACSDVNVGMHRVGDLGNASRRTR
jgi:hypothetical protein